MQTKYPIAYYYVGNHEIDIYFDDNGNYLDYDFGTKNIPVYQNNEGILSLKQELIYGLTSYCYKLTHCPCKKIEDDLYKSTLKSIAYDSIGFSFFGYGKTKSEAIENLFKLVVSIMKCEESNESEH